MSYEHSNCVCSIYLLENTVFRQPVQIIAVLMWSICDKSLIPVAVLSKA
jgi:hypothetical protein